MPRMTSDEIKVLRRTLKLSEGEFAERIELDDRQLIKQLESGSLKPSPNVNKMLMRLLSRSAGRSPKLKKMQTSIKDRSKNLWL